MLASYVDFFPPVALSLVAAMGGALVGIALIESVAPNGARALGRQFVVACFLAAIAFGIGAYLYEGQAYNDKFELFVYCIAPGCAGLGLFFAALVSYLVCPGQMREYLAMAQQVEPVIGKHFPLLDDDQDGVLSRADMLKSLKKSNFLTNEERQVVRFTANNIRAIGHDVGSYRSGKTDIRVAVISLRDLEGFTARINSRYGAWR